ncbi:MAG: flavin reductase family protein [Candidatus Bathyarchaeota archaeon]|nr:flavin reductase family protein [Candidatus Bathyarchaeota archaeon]
MGKIIIDENYAGADWYFMLHPLKAILVTTADIDGNPNILAVGWCMPCSHKPWRVAIAIHPLRYSHKLIAETKEFTINVPTVELAYQTQYCGEYSGRDVNKFKEAGLTPSPGKKVKAPSIEECVAFMECKVVNLFNTGDHTTFIGEVVYAEAEEDYIKAKSDSRTVPNRYFDPGAVKTLLHLGADAYVTASSELYKPDVPPPARSWKEQQLGKN